MVVGWQKRQRQQAGDTEKVLGDAEDMADRWHKGRI